MIASRQGRPSFTPAFAASAVVGSSESFCNQGRAHLPIAHKQTRSPAIISVEARQLPLARFRPTPANAKLPRGQEPVRSSIAGRFHRSARLRTVFHAKGCVLHVRAAPQVDLIRTSGDSQEICHLNMWFRRNKGDKPSSRICDPTRRLSQSVPRSTVGDFSDLRLTCPNHRSKPILAARCDACTLGAQRCIGREAVVRRRCADRSSSLALIISI